MQVDLLGATPFDPWMKGQTFQQFLHPSKESVRQAQQAQVAAGQKILDSEAAAAKKKPWLTYAALAAGAYFLLKG